VNKILYKELKGENTMSDKFIDNDEGPHDHEASMARSQLYHMIKRSIHLFEMIEHGENLEGWVAAKITKAADYINSVHDYLIYEKKFNKQHEFSGEYFEALEKKLQSKIFESLSEEDSDNPYRNYKMTYEQGAWDKSHDVVLTTLDLKDSKAWKEQDKKYPDAISDNDPTKMTPERLKFLIKNHPQHQKIIKQGYRVSKFGEHVPSRWGGKTKEI
jgi:hypothetical protein